MHLNGKAIKRQYTLKNKTTKKNEVIAFQMGFVMKITKVIKKKLKKQSVMGYLKLWSGVAKLQIMPTVGAKFITRSVRILVIEKFYVQFLLTSWSDGRKWDAKLVRIFLIKGRRHGA